MPEDDWRTVLAFTQEPVDPLPVYDALYAAWTLGWRPKQTRRKQRPKILV